MCCRNILFWNYVQIVVLVSLDRQNATYSGDFGGGKTAKLIEGAIRCAAIWGGTVIFISSLCSWDENKDEAVEERVLGLALEMRFKEAGVEVVTARSIRKELGTKWEKQKDVHFLI